MSELFIYGASDDLLEVEGEADEEFGMPFGSPHGLTIVVEAPTGNRVWVRGAFDSDAALREVGDGWCLSVLHAESGGWPWPIRFGSRGNGHDADPALIVGCPKGTTVREWGADE